MTGAMWKRLLAGIAAAVLLADAARAEPPMWVVRDKDSELVLFGCAYLALALWKLVGERREVPRLLYDGFRAKYSELAADPPPKAH